MVGAEGEEGEGDLGEGREGAGGAWEATGSSCRRRLLVLKRIECRGRTEGAVAACSEIDRKGGGGGGSQRGEGRKRDNNREMTLLLMTRAFFCLSCPLMMPTAYVVEIAAFENAWQ